MEEAEAPDMLLVNKDIFVASLVALGAFMESTSENFEEIRKSKYFGGEEKKVMLSILANNLDAAVRILDGFEAAMQQPIDPYYDKPSLN